MPKLRSRKLLICLKVTKMGSIIGQTIDYNGVGAERGGPTENRLGELGSLYKYYYYYYYHYKRPAAHAQQKCSQVPPREKVAYN